MSKRRRKSKQNERDKFNGIMGIGMRIVSCVVYKEDNNNNNNNLN